MNTPAMPLLSRSSSTVRERRDASARVSCARAEPAESQFWDTRENPSVPATCVVRRRRGPRNGAHEPARLSATDDAVPQQSAADRNSGPARSRTSLPNAQQDRRGHECSDGSVNRPLENVRGRLYGSATVRRGIGSGSWSPSTRTRSGSQPVATPQLRGVGVERSSVIARGRRTGCSARSTRDAVKSRSRSAGARALVNTCCVTSTGNRVAGAERRAKGRR